MQTAMSCALSKAGLITEEQASQVISIPYHLKPYSKQINEIGRLTTLLEQSDVKTDLLDVGTVVAFQAMIRRGEYADGYEMMLSYLQKKATSLGIS